jgi:hypothetical protein
MQQPKANKLSTHSAVTFFRNLKATNCVAENVFSDRATFHFSGHFNRYIGAVIWGNNKPHAVTTRTTDSRSKFHFVLSIHCTKLSTFAKNTVTGIEYPDTLEKFPMQIFEG